MITVLSDSYDTAIARACISAIAKVVEILARNGANLNVTDEVAMKLSQYFAFA